MGYPDLTRWKTVVQEPANPVVAENLLAGKYDAGVTFVAFGEEHPQELRVLKRYGEVDTTWLVYGRRRRYAGELIGRRIPEFPQRRARARMRPPENGVVNRARYPAVTVGEGYAVGSIDDFEQGYGFRKVRRGLGVTAFGVNALVRPEGYETKWHYHEVREELYFVHRGSIEMEFGDGSSHVLKGGNVCARRPCHDPVYQDPRSGRDDLHLRGRQGRLYRP